LIDGQSQQQKHCGCVFRKATVDVLLHGS
jgi:hypothetical protein